MAHVHEFIQRYGMYGRASAESFESLHVLIEMLKQLCKSQSASQRIASANAKAQSMCKAEIRSANKAINESRKGKPRGPYNIDRSSVDNSDKFQRPAYSTITVGGEDFIEVMQGKQRIPKKWLELYNLLMHNLAPEEWAATFQNACQLTTEMKQKLSYTD